MVPETSAKMHAANCTLGQPLGPPPGLKRRNRKAEPAQVLATAVLAAAALATAMRAAHVA
jgi:hypothetical protein